MINLVMTKITFKVKSLRIQQNKEALGEFFLLADTWDGYSTRLCTGSYDLCRIVKESIDASILDGKNAHRLDIRTAYAELRQRDIKGSQPLPAEQLAILAKAMPEPVEVEDETPIEEGIISKADYEYVEQRLMKMLSARPSKRNTWVSVSLERMARAMQLSTDEMACLEKAVKIYCLAHDIHPTRLGTTYMYELPFKGNSYEILG